MQPDIKDGIGILRACRQLNQEIIPYLYDDVFEIHVDPIWSKYLKIENGQGATWDIDNTRDPLYEAFCNLPYEKLRKLEVSIAAPETGNQAQLISLSKHVRDLVRLLEQKKSLPNLEIHLLDSKDPTGMWVLPDGTIKTTVDRRSYNRSSRDYMIVLLPFCRLRNIPLVSIKAPADLSASEGKYFKCMEKVMQRTGRFGDVKGPPFGSGEGGVSYWDDNNIQQMCDDKYIDLEDELDELHGKDANMMRLERFMYWYNEDGTSEYVSEWERMNREQYAKVDPDYAADIDDRHDWLLTLNPMSKAMQTMRLQLQVPPCYRQSSFSLSACFDMNKCARYFEVLERIKAMKDIWSSEFELVTSNSVIDGLRTTWSQKAWLEYYPLGIEPLIIFTPPHKDYLKVHSGMDECEHHKEEVVLDGSLDYEDILDRIPRGVDRVLEQKKHIDFEVGERTRLALESLIKNPAEAGTIWDPRMVTYGVAV